jgi:endoglucanase
MVFPASLKIRVTWLITLLLMITACSGEKEKGLIRDRFGAVTGFDETGKTLYLLFSAHDHFEGMETVLGTLEKSGVRASFFLTGECLREKDREETIRRIVDQGHYLGPHSDAHLLYVPWDVGPDRDSLLVTRDEFEKDLRRNLEALRPFGRTPENVRWFLPPYEWYNTEIVEWSVEMGLEVVNFTSGIGTNADYTTPGMPNYRTTEEIITRLWEYEEVHGLNGKILLIHPGVGPERPDPLYDRLFEIIFLLKEKGYEFKRLKKAAHYNMCSLR